MIELRFYILSSEIQFWEFGLGLESIADGLNRYSNIKAFE